MSTAGSPATAQRKPLDSDNPWPGLLEYREEDQAFFKGRVSEAEQLHSLVMDHRVTLLLANSGTGKTSLVKAGLLPRLETEVLPVYHRLVFSDKAPTPGEQLLEALEREAVRRGFDFARRRDSDGLWEHLHRRDAVFWTRRHRAGLPLIILDQFEEIFTLGASSGIRGQCDEFQTQLADLVEGQPPLGLKQRIQESPRLASAFDVRSHRFRILICLREEYLAEMETLRRRAPSIMDTRFRLTPMAPSRAREVVQAGSHLLAEGVGEEILRTAIGIGRHVAPPEDAMVEPFLLSLLCAELNEKRKASEAAVITSSLVTGTKEEILRDFYEGCMKDILPPERRVLEETLVLKTGHRDTRARTELFDLGVRPHTLDRLVDLRLLRGEERSGVGRVELTHDVLAPLVEASRTQRRQIEAQKTREDELRALIEKEREAKRAELQRLADVERGRREEARAVGVAFGVVWILLAFVSSLLFSVPESFWGLLDLSLAGILVCTAVAVCGIALGAGSRGGARRWLPRSPWMSLPLIAVALPLSGIPGYMLADGVADRLPVGAQDYRVCYASFKSHFGERVESGRTIPGLERLNRFITANNRRPLDGSEESVTQVWRLYDAVKDGLKVSGAYFSLTSGLALLRTCVRAFRAVLVLSGLVFIVLVAATIKSSWRTSLRRRALPVAAGCFFVAVLSYWVWGRCNDVYFGRLFTTYEGSARVSGADGGRSQSEPGAEADSRQALTP